jgi:PAS domain S-box-containing protein
LAGGMNRRRLAEASKPPTDRGRPGRRALDEERLLAAMLVEYSDEAIIGMTPQGVITTWNRAAQRLYGYSTEDVVGRNISFLLPADRFEELEAILGRVANGAGAQHYETTRIHKDGGVIDIGITVSPIHDLAGTMIVGTSTIQRDITDRKRTDAVTAEMAAIVDSSNDAIIGKTLDGVITTWNRGAEGVYGYTAGEMIGKSISLLVPKERPDEDHEIIAGMLASENGTNHLETQRLHKDGRRIDVSLTESPIRDPGGAIVGASSVARDTTKQNEMAAALKATELRSVLAISRAKDEMVALVSHELRTPLASLLGFTELLYSRDFPDEKRRQYLGVMLREGRRLTNLINDVLRIQRLEAGHQTLNLGPADLEALIQRAVNATGEDPERPIEVRLRAGLPLVMIDSDSILQVLSNFLSNARKYSPGGGSIRVTTRLHGGMVEIDVQDHGLGLSEDALTKVFATFYRVESGDRRLIQGIGLGLAINRRIVEAHGGQVGAYSGGPGEGSRFQFTLPTIHESPKEADVLIIEDDSSFARMLQEQFVSRGMTTVRTADAETALRMLREGMKPRAVVTDLLLPGLQGEEFLSKLAADNDIAAVPVLVLTVKTVAAPEISALEKLGVTAVMPKEAGASLMAVSVITEALRL